MLKILNASPGSGTSLNEQEVKDFLTTKVLDLHLGTVDKNAHSNIHRVEYYYDRSDDKFHIITYPNVRVEENSKSQIMEWFTSVSTIQILHLKE
jgi:hypothetical protein